MSITLAAALVNFLWQGLAIGLAAWLGFTLSRSARMRYLIGVAALALMAASPVATVALSRRAEIQRSSFNVPGSTEIAVSATRSGGEASRRRIQTSDESGTLRASLGELAKRVDDPRAASIVLGAWLVGVALLSVRLTIGWLGVRRMTARVSTAKATVQVAASRLTAAMNIRASVRVVESLLVQVPAVVGVFKPVVLLPAAAMSGLSMEQVEALLAHELAHVRRHDYLVNLLQSAIETLLFYHPAVWLVSRRVRQERELCCDDLALEVCSDRVAYASALADLESLRVLPSPAMAATGGSLLTRVRRILGNDEVSALAGRSQSLAGVAILASILLLVGGQAARAKAVLPATVPDLRRAEWSATPPQAPPQGVVGGVADGIPGGVKGGVKGGVVGGVPGGVVGGAKGGVAGGVVDQQQVVAVDRTSIDVEAPKASVDQQGPSAYVLAPRDVIRVDVTVGVVGQTEFNKSYDISAGGAIEVPYIGVVRASGLTTVALQEAIASSLAGSGTLPGARVVVTVLRYRNQTVTVQGAVRTPGNIPLRAGRLTLADAIAVAGGAQPGAGQVAQTFGVTGYVKNPGKYTWEAGMTVEKALALAGGITPQGAPRRISIKRKDLKTGELVTIKVDKLDMEVQPDDVIIVPERYF